MRIDENTVNATTTLHFSPAKYLTSSSAPSKSSVVSANHMGLMIPRGVSARKSQLTTFAGFLSVIQGFLKCKSTLAACIGTARIQNLTSCLQNKPIHIVAKKGVCQMPDTTVPYHEPLGPM